MIRLLSAPSVGGIATTLIRAATFHVTQVLEAVHSRDGVVLGPLDVLMAGWVVQLYQLLAEVVQGEADDVQEVSTDVLHQHAAQGLDPIAASFVPASSEVGRREETGLQEELTSTGSEGPRLVLPSQQTPTQPTSPWAATHEGAGLRVKVHLMLLSLLWATTGRRVAEGEAALHARLGVWSVDCSQGPNPHIPGPGASAETSLWRNEGP